MECNIKSNQKLLTIISASNRPHNMAAFLENLNDTLDDPRSVEVLVKIDDGDDVMRNLLEDAVKRYPYEIRFIQTARLDGYYTLHYGYQELYNISDPQTYFIFPVNEEVRFLTKGWDTVLRRYVGLYHDHMFRLKISRLKYRNYYSYHDCGPCPENYPISTRVWYELSEGIGDCWGPDGWHQYIDYHLGVCQGINGIPGIFRSIPIQDILIGGEEAGKELSKEQMRRRAHRIYCEWWRMYSPTVQQKIRRLATKMAAYIWAKNEGLTDFTLQEDKKSMIFYIINKESGQAAGHFYYYLSKWHIRYQNFGFLVNAIRQNNLGFTKSYIQFATLKSHFFAKAFDYTLRTFVVLLAFILSIFTRGFHSGPKNWFGLQYRRLRHFMIEVQYRVFGEQSFWVKNIDTTKYRKIRKVSSIINMVFLHPIMTAKIVMKRSILAVLKYSLGDERGVDAGRKLRSLYSFVRGK